MKYVFKYNLTNNVATENKLKEESVKNTITSYKDLSGNAKEFVSKVKEYIDNYGTNEGLLKLREIYSIKDEEFSFIVDFLVEKRGYKAEDFDKNLFKKETADKIETLATDNINMQINQILSNKIFIIEGVYISQPT